MAKYDGSVSCAENLELTSTGSDTPMGNLLRRYWWPVAVTADLEDRPTYIRILGEDLVLFRDRRGRIGLLGARCAHRRANLCIGTTGAEGLRCRYHGWLFDTHGRLLDTPGVSLGPDFRNRVRQLSYPVEELGGLLFAYLGPAPAPPLPRFDFMVQPGQRIARIIGFADSNWLQLAENGVDPLHVTFAHAMTWKGVAAAPVHLSFEETEWGLVYRSGRPIDRQNQYAFRKQHWLMPGATLASEGYGRMTSNDFGAFRGGHDLMPRGVRYNVPIDDTHTMLVRVIWLPEGTPAQYAEPLLQTPDWRQEAVEPYREYRRMEDATALGYDWPVSVSAQDATILDSMGPISDREHEHLMPSDRGVVMIRKLLRDALKAVASGQDPKGIIRDQARNELIEVQVFEDILSKSEFERATQSYIDAE